MIEPAASAGNASSTGVASFALMRRLVPGVALVGALVAAAVLAGWAADIAWLKSVRPGLGAMKANAAAAFLLSFAALWCLAPSVSSRPRRAAGLASAAGAALVGAATLFEYGARVDLGIDELLFKDDLKARQWFGPGRMGPNTALCFALSGTGLALLRARSAGARAAAQWLAAVSLTVAAAPTLAYLFSTTAAGGLASHMPMALHTASLFIALDLCMLLAGAEDGFMAGVAAASPGGTAARRLLAAIVLFIPAAAWLRLEGERQGLFGLEAGLSVYTLFNIVFLSVVTVAVAAAVDRQWKLRQSSEAQLRQAQKMEAVGQLTGGVAHDFNNLLTVIVTNAELLHDHAKERDPAAAKLAARVLAAAQRGAALTQRLLAFSRRQVLQPKRLDLNQVIGSMNDLLRRTLGETVEVEMVLAAGLWPATADREQVESALLNLAVNARDAMPRGGKLTIETANVRFDDAYAAANVDVKPGQYVMLAVTDTGTGMAPEIAARAFEPFFTTKEQGKGTGLGLSMVYGFAKQSGGNVKIYSEPGQGTTIKFYLARAADGAGAEPARPGPAESPRPARGEVVLVVEDDPGVRDTAVQILRGLGYAPIAAADGPAALAALDAAARVDLLFTDIVMPRGMSGRELAAEAQRRSPGLKVLYASGYTPNAIVHHGRLDDGVDLVQKPYTVNELARRIARILGRQET